MKFKINDTIHLVNNPSKKGSIKEIGIIHAGNQYYTVFWSGDEIYTHCEDELMLDFTTKSPIDSLLNSLFGGYREFQKLLTLKRLDKEVPLRNNIYAFNATRTKFFPYQFKPLIKFLDSPKNRILICDEVGLGKTIEAGLILTELRARNNPQRILIVCPASLTTKWKIELLSRFDENFDILKKKKFIEKLTEIHKYPELGFNIIISLESIRNDDVIEKLQNVMPDFDLVIIDEAHKLRNPGTKQWKVGKELSNFSKSMVMLTATPIHLGIENLYHLLNILDDQDFNDLYSANQRFKDNTPLIKSQMCLANIPPQINEAIGYLKEIENRQYFKNNFFLKSTIEQFEKAKKNDFSQKENLELLINLQRDLSDLNLIGHIYSRTRKREVHQDVAVREAIAHLVKFSDEERQFYDAVTDDIKQKVNTDNEGFTKWLLNIPQRRMSSSIPVMVKHYREKLLNDFETIYENSDEEIKSDINDSLNEIINNWSDKIPDSKYNKFLEIIEKEKLELGKVKIMVFAFFKGTLKYLEKRLDADGIMCRRIDGDVIIENREKNISEFKSNEEIEVLLSSIVGGEGLDFQFCNTIFNYDLPWNPMEMEQRIGRIDRIGQKAKKIFIHNLFIENSIEERILSRLYKRIEIFKHSIGEIEPIIGDIVSKLNKLIFSNTLSKEEEEKRIYEWEIASKRKLLEFKEIENNAGQFIGTDKYFEIEIDNIKKQRRYVTGKQLEIFILDFISNYCPQTRIEYDYEYQIGYIFPDEELKLLIKKFQQTQVLYTFMSKFRKKIRITFDSEVAFENKEVEFINILHPLVNLIINLYKSNKQSFPNANYFALKTKLLDEGFYVYSIYRLNINGAKKISTLEAIILNDNLEQVISSLETEEILGEMIECGSEGIEKIEFDKNWVKKAILTCEQIFMLRADELLEKNRQRNENFIKIRLKSLEINFNKVEMWTSEQLRKTDKAFRIKMLNAQLEKKRLSFEEKKMELESNRFISKNHELISVGILEVLS